MSSEKVLVIDDEKDIRSLIAKYLKNENMIVFEACCSGEAISCYKKNDLDIPIIIFSAQEFDISHYQGVTHFLKSKSKIDNIHTLNMHINILDTP